MNGGGGKPGGVSRFQEEAELHGSWRVLGGGRCKAGSQEMGLKDISLRPYVVEAKGVERWVCPGRRVGEKGTGDRNGWGLWGNERWKNQRRTDDGKEGERKPGRGGGEGAGDGAAGSWPLLPC